MSPPKRILVTRTDRLGDVFMSLHAVRCLREALPETQIDFVVREEFFPLLQSWLSGWPVGLISWPIKNPLVLRADAALFLYDEPGLSKQVRESGTPVRIGNFSKLRSFWNLTGGARQRRALGRRSEGEYNLELARLFLQKLGVVSRYQGEKLLLPPPASSARTTALEGVGVHSGEPYWIAHPGMGGSALNLSAAAYVELLSRIEKEQKGPLVLTLGPAPADLSLVEAIVDKRPDWRVLPPVSLSTLAEVFRGASLVVAPSTGPLHLAHYVGADTLGIYSPVRSHQPRRWAPWGGAGLSRILWPEPPCPGKSECLGPRCKRFYCMDRMIQAGSAGTGTFAWQPH